MEKIIAVVVMIAIVVGLIGGLVMPMVGTMNEQGGKAQSELNLMGQTMGDDLLSGATVKAEIATNKVKFGLDARKKLTSIKIVGESGATAEATDAAGITNLYNVLLEKAVYKKTITAYPSGDLKTITYTLQQ